MPTEVVYNAELDMNREKILNIAPDKTRNNSAGTVKMVKELYPYTKIMCTRKYLRNFMISVMLATGPSGIIFTCINPNITFPQMNIANVCEGGLR